VERNTHRLRAVHHLGKKKTSFRSELSRQPTCARGNCNLRDSTAQRPSQPQHRDCRLGCSARPGGRMNSGFHASVLVRQTPTRAGSTCHRLNENIFIGEQRGSPPPSLPPSPPLHSSFTLSALPSPPSALSPLLLLPPRFPVLLSRLTGTCQHTL